MSQVAPLQRKMLSLVRASGENLDWDAYKRLSHAWELWGAVALITPALAAVLMIMKPAIPGLGH